jgi:hypothetical protein
VKALPLLLSGQLLIAALVPGRSLQELAKVPGLIGHYRHHVADHGSISFLDFLNLHYGNPSHRHDREEHHEELPFKTLTTDFSGVFCLPVAVLSREAADSFQLTQAVTGTSSPLEAASYVWHPPRT